MWTCDNGHAIPPGKSFAAVAEPTCGPATFPRHREQRRSLARIPPRGRRNTPRNTLTTPSRNIRRPTAAGRSRNSSRPPRKTTFRLSRRSHCQTRRLPGAYGHPAPGAPAVGGPDLYAHGRARAGRVRLTVRRTPGDRMSLPFPAAGRRTLSAAVGWVLRTGAVRLLWSRRTRGLRQRPVRRRRGHAGVRLPRPDPPAVGRRLPSSHPRPASGSSGRPVPPGPRRLRRSGSPRPGSGTSRPARLRPRPVRPRPAGGGRPPARRRRRRPRQYS